MKTKPGWSMLWRMCGAGICLPSILNGLESARVERLFNFGWTFHYGPVEGAMQPDFDDHEWRILDLPHDFQIEQDWVESGYANRGFKPMGEGWYRKSFVPDPEWEGRRILVDFEGIMLTGEIWFNGEKIGSVDYGYLGAEYDLTQLVRWGERNVLVVRASTGESGDSRWYTGGGLFRDVHLVVKDAISIARHGVFITTPQVSETQAEIQLQVALEGMTRNPAEIGIRADVFDPDGQLVGNVQFPAPTDSKLKTVEVKLPVIRLRDPLLWSCERPHLYHVTVSLVRGDTLLDAVSETFGVRSIEFSPEFGFKLNGKKVFLKGISNHHDLGALGAAVHDQAIERLFLKLKEFGFNHVRTSHNPYSESFLRLADKHGLLIVDELFDKWGDKTYWPGSKPFTQIWYPLVSEWIQRDRNHPSVIMWSFGNELQMREDLIGFPSGDWGVTTYRILDLVAKRYDPTRKTTVAMHPSRANAVSKRDPEYAQMIPPELSVATEIASYNYQYPAYPTYLKHAPGLIVYQSEATTRELGAPFFGMDRERMVGLAYWGAVEYWGESDGWPKKGWNYSFFNHALEPYPQAYLIKSLFCEEPVVRLGVVESEVEKLEWNDVWVGRLPVTSHWNWTEGSMLNLFTYTNAEEVELFINGKSLGTQRNNSEVIDQRNMLYWKDVPYEQGGEVMAIARNHGKEAARHQLQSTGEAIELELKVENEDWKADGMDLQYVRVYAVDAEGHRVSTAQGSVSFEVTGAGKLIAVDNGDHRSNQLFQTNQTQFHHGFAMAILRSTHAVGSVNLKVVSEHTEAGALSLYTEPP